MRVQLPDTCSQNQLFTSKPMYRYIECQQMLSHSRVYPLNRGKIVPYFWQEVKSIASCFVQTYFVKVVSIRYLLFWAWWKVKQFWMLTVSMSVNHQPAGKMQSVRMDWLENFTIEFVLDFHNTSSVYPMKPINPSLWWSPTLTVPVFYKLSSLRHMLHFIWSPWKQNTRIV